jgi:uncharacterized membrane protein
MADERGYLSLNFVLSTRFDTISSILVASFLMKWGTKMRAYVYLAAAVATLVAAAPAAAQQASATALAKGVVVQPLTLAKLQDLDFGTVVGSAAAGTVTIDADTGARSTVGGVTGVPSYPGGRGLFQGNGAAAQTVLLQLNAPAVLVSTTNPLDTITVNSMVLDTGNSTTRTIGATGLFNIGVGGTFGIGANQPAALYQANFTVTADYQ